VIARSELPGARSDTLFFGQVCEDQRLEVTALRDHLDSPIAVVTSGGCTALSLIAEGAVDVTGIDLNRSQNHLAELKAVAVSSLGTVAATALLGGTPAEQASRGQAYQEIRTFLSAGARAYWDAQPRVIAAGVLNAGAAERLYRIIAWTTRALVHPKARVQALLQQQDLARQQAFYDGTWNTRRWRWVFAVLANRFVLRANYTPEFFEHLVNPSFALHFHGTFERGLRDLPIGDNYFAQYIFGGHFTPQARPPYLDPANEARLAGAQQRLSLADASYLDYLRGQPDASIGGFALSNICEWLTAEQIDELFAQVVRTARPDARLVFRNFVGWTEVPRRWQQHVVEDVPLGEKLIALDRSLCQRRIAVCDIRKDPS
jgi:S-adenosylmethionine-diacylglycerol 3-amino-3-carboxypropyl transferase